MKKSTKIILAGALATVSLVSLGRMSHYKKMSAVWEFTARLVRQADDSLYWEHWYDEEMSQYRIFVNSKECDDAEAMAQEFTKFFQDRRVGIDCGVWSADIEGHVESVSSNWRE